MKTLEIRQELVKALEEEGITEPTSIQAQSIPLALKGRDIIGISKTGSGKTAAFSIPILEKIQQGQGLQAVVLSPTRELAVQIANELKKFGKYQKFKVATIYGGVSINPQIDRLEISEIMVGTPGRVLDHVRRNTINLTKVKIAVLDEADKMVEMGFIEDVTEILSYTPKGRQMLLFGATISREVESIKKRFMTDPVTVKAETQVEDEFLEQYYYDLESREKFSYLVHLLTKPEVKKAIIFCSTRSTVDVVARNLKSQGIHALAIHGNLTQNKRLDVMKAFNDDKIDVIVASAVAARGLDIRDVTHVFNYDLPQDPQEYIHRIGRTARAGDKGKAITLLSQDNHEHFDNILNRYPVNIKKLEKEEFKKLPFQIQRRDSFRRDFNQRGRHFSGRGNRDSRSTHSKPSGPRTFGVQLNRGNNFRKH